MGGWRTREAGFMPAQQLVTYREPSGTRRTVVASEVHRAPTGSPGAVHIVPADGEPSLLLRAKDVLSVVVVDLRN